MTGLEISLFKSEHDLLVAARSLSGAKPQPGVRVQLVSRNNRILGEAVTDEDGIARFDGNLARGKRGNALLGVMAFVGEAELAFVDASTDMLDLGDRGIDGRLPAGVLDAYVYTERGIYRPGETVHVGIIVRDSAGQPIDPADTPPLSYRVRAANNTEILSDDLKEPQDGAYALNFHIPETALSGLWHLDVSLGHGGERIGSVGFEVGDFRLGRIFVELEDDRRQPLAQDSEKELKVRAEYLYGAPYSAPASNLPGEAIVEIREAAVPWAARWAAEAYNAFPAEHAPTDFSFGLADGEFASQA